MSKKPQKTTTSKSKSKAGSVPENSGIYYGDLPPRHRPRKAEPPKPPKPSVPELRKGPEPKPDSQ